MNAPAPTVRLALVLLAALCGGCDQPTAQDLANDSDPIASLRSPVRSARYDGGYWHREARQDSVLWRHAVFYCRTPGSSGAPNCQTVGLVLSTIELEQVAKEARRQLRELLDQGQAFNSPRQAAPVGGGR